MSQQTSKSNIVKYLIKKYYRGSLDFELKPEDVEELTWSKQEQFLDATTNSPLLIRYPVKYTFARLFFKKFINYLEGNQEVHDELYTILCMTMNIDDSHEFCHRHYVIGNDLKDIVTIKETNNMVVNGTTGMRTWEAAIMLTDWALCNIEVFENKNILELGSGVGFTGISIAKFCRTKSMFLSDYHEDVLNTIESNIAINFPSWNCNKSSKIISYISTDHTIGVINLDWNEISELPTAICPDIIIGADIIYDPSILKPLRDIILNFLEINQNVEIIIAGVLRNHETFNMFLELLDSSDFHYIKLEQPVNVNIEWECKMEKYLLKINKKNLIKT